MEEMPNGFPLSPTDAFGNPLSVGAVVEIRSVASCQTGLPQEDQKRLLSLVGHKRQIVEFDRFGFVWLSFSELESNSDFCLFPAEVSLV
jgi:hypothetical protein